MCTIIMCVHAYDGVHVIQHLSVCMYTCTVYACLLNNLSSVPNSPSDDDEDDNGWEDEGEMEEIIGERAEETEMETDSLHQVMSQR